MGALLIVPIGAYVACTVVCMQKGKANFALIGLLAAFPPLAILFGWFPVVGSIRMAKPSSSWARSRYDEAQMQESRSRFPEDGAAEAPPPPREWRPPAPTPNPAPQPKPEPTAPTRTVTLPTRPKGYRTVVSAFLFRAAKAGAIDAAAYERLKAFLDHEEMPATAPAPAAAATETIEKKPASPAPKTAPPPRPTPAPPVERPRPPAPAKPEPPVERPAPTPQPPQPAPRAPSPQPAPRAPQPQPAPAPAPPRITPAPPPQPREPSRLARRAAAVWEAFSSDIALHGFAYLGVLLTLVGVLGFLLFSFADLQTGVKPFVELSIAFVFFGWAWLLRRQDARRVAAGMDLIGKILLPLIVFAGLVDSAPFPPDFEGDALIVALTTATLLLAAGYAVLALRNAASLFRYLVAPLIWLSAMTIGLVFKNDEHLVGDAITRLVSMQPALASVAIAVTLLAVLRNRDHLLAKPTVVSSLAGLPIAYLLAVSLEAGDGWSNPTAIAVLGAGTLVSAELLTRWFDEMTLRAWLRPLLLAGVLAPLVPSLDTGWAGLVIAVSYLLIGEWTRRTIAVTAPLSLAAAGTAVGAAMSVADPAAMLTTFSVLSAWAHLRRPGLGRTTQIGLVVTALAAVLPVGIGVALARMFDGDVAWLVMALILGTVSFVVLAARAKDSFWAVWPTLAALTVASGAGSTWAADGRASQSGPWAVAVAALVVIAGSYWKVGRVWLAGALGAAATAMALETAAVSANQQAAVWASLGAGLVVISAAFHRRPFGHVAVIGHLVGAGSLLYLADGETGAFVLGAWTAAWVVTVAAGRPGWEGLTSLLERAATPPDEATPTQWPAHAARWLAPVVMAASIPPSVLAVADLWDRFAANRSWTGVALGAIAVSYAATARRAGSPLRRVLAIGAITTSIIGVAVAAPVSLPIIATTTAVIVVAALLTGDLRSAGFVWFAWIVSVLLAMQIGRQAGIDTEHVYLVSLGYGALMLIGGLLLDNRRAGVRAPGDGIRVGWLRHPVLVGAAAVPLSLGPVYELGTTTFGWASIGAGAMYFVVAGLLRAGAVTAPGYGLVTVGIAAVSPWSMLDHPWRFAVVAAPMVLVSHLIASSQQREAASDPFLRWDIPPLVAAHVVAAFALVFGLNNGTGPETAAAFGALSIATGVLRRNRAWVEAGNALLIAAAFGMGDGWPTFALAATAVRGVIGTGLSSGLARTAYQWTGVLAAAASWASLASWQGWSGSEIMSATALGFAALAVVVAVWLRFFDLPLDTTWIWGGLAVSGVSVAAFMGLNLERLPAVDGPWLATGLALLSGAFVLATPKLGGGAAIAAVFAAGASWPALSAGLAWDRAEFAFVTSLVFGAATVVVASATRLLVPSRVAAVGWLTLGLTGVAVAGLVSALPGVDPLWGPAVAVGFVAVALALEIAAPALAAGLRYAAVVSAGIGWVALADGLRWDDGRLATFTALAFGAVALGIAAAARLAWLGRDATLRWGALATVGVVSAWAVTIGPGVDAFWEPAAAVGLVALAIALEVAAPVIGTAARYASVAASGAAWLALAEAAGWNRSQFSLATTLTFGAMAFFVGGLVAARLRGGSFAARWGSLAVVGTATGAIASIGSPDGPVWAPGVALGLVLMATGLELAAHRLEIHALRYASVVAVGAAWIALSDGLGWTVAEFAFATALLFGTAALLLGGLATVQRVSGDFIARWGALTVVGVATAAIAATTHGTAHWDLAATAALLALAVGFELAARRVGRFLQYLSVVAVGSAWGSASHALDWTLATFASSTALTFGALAAATGLIARSTKPSPQFIARWGSLALIGVFVGATASLAVEGDPTWGPAAAVGVGAAAAGLQLGANRVDASLRFWAVATSGTAWLLLIDGMSLTTLETVAATTITFGALALIAAELGRAFSRSEEWAQRHLTAAWFGLGATGSALAALAAVAEGTDEHLRWAALAAAAVAVGFARAARPLRAPWLRAAAGPVALAAVTSAGFGFDAADTAIALTVVGFSVAGTAIALSLWQRHPDSQWMTPLVVLSTAANIEAAAFALQALPERGLLVTVLFSVGLQALALGMALDRPALLALSPPVIGAAFILMIAENVGGSAQWYTAPIGLVLLGEVEVLRKVIRDRQLAIVGPQVAGLEWAGVGLLGAPPLVEMFTTGIAFGLIAFAVSALLLIWSIVTKIRRRAVAAASLAVASAVLVLFAGAAAGAPDNAFFWIVAVGVGFSVMLVAALIEAYRSKKGRFMERVEVLMEEWE